MVLKSSLEEDTSNNLITGDVSTLPFSVLYIHPSGTFGGASRSLLELITSLPENTVIPYVVTPLGNVPEIFTSYGIEVICTRGLSQFDNTRYGYYRRHRWLIILRELFFLPYTCMVLLRARIRYKDVQIVHVNDITLLLPAILAKLLFRCPIVMHVRSIQQTSRAKLRYRIISFIIHKLADAIVAIDSTVRSSLPANLPVKIIHNGYTPEDTADTPGEELQDNQNASRDRIVVSYLGNFLKSKGIYDFLEAARICVSRGLDVEFLIVGGNTRTLTGVRAFLLKALGFAHDVKSDIESFIHNNDFEDIITLVDFTFDIASIYKKIDVICFPSHLGAPGRPVFEAAFHRVPSIVAVKDPSPDTLIHRTTGLSIEPGNTDELADAIEYFCRNPDEIRKMGNAAYDLVLSNYNASTNSLKMLELYSFLINREWGI